MGGPVHFTSSLAPRQFQRETALPSALIPVLAPYLNYLSDCGLHFWQILPTSPGEVLQISAQLCRSASCGATYVRIDLQHVLISFDFLENNTVSSQRFEIERSKIALIVSFLSLRSCDKFPAHLHPCSEGLGPFLFGPSEFQFPRFTVLLSR